MLSDDDDDDDFLAPAASWAATSRSTIKSEESNGDLFSHRNEFESIAKDSFKYEKEKAARLKAKQDKAAKHREENTSPKVVKRESDGVEGQDGLKRRRINAEDSKKLLAMAGLSKTSVINIDDSDDETEAGPSMPARRPLRNNRTKDVVSPSKLDKDGALADEIVYDDVLEVTTIVGPPASTQPQPEEQVEEEEEYDSDPEIAAIMRRAKENARRKRDLAKQASTLGEASASHTGQLPTPPPADATIQLLITSPIPGSIPLICHRKLSQILSVVRQAWCDRNKYDKAAADKIFFTYRGTRLYDSTTVQRLGISADAFGNVYREDDPSGEDDGKVHIEAVTDEIFRERKLERARLARLATTQYEEQAKGEPQEEEGEAQNEAQNKQQKLIVRAKGKPDFKLKVLPTTKFHKIIKAAKRSFGFADEQRVYIVFDDERLSPDELVGNTEMEDMDIVDMHLGS